MQSNLSEPGKEGRVINILIAEDDPTSRMILKAVLTKWGYEVIEAKDGTEAWEVLQREDAPRLVILDVIMPGMSGETICRKLRETKRVPPTYVIILTSKRSQSDLVSGLNAGANDYIRKPFDRPELRARLKVGERILEIQDALAQRDRASENRLAPAQPLDSMLSRNLKLYDEINRHLGYLEAIATESRHSFSEDRRYFDANFARLASDTLRRLDNLKDLIPDLLQI
jgi:CheY-like chemotaxis protein